MSKTKHPGDVLVGLSNPATLNNLLDAGAALARETSGALQPCWVRGPDALAAGMARLLTERCQAWASEHGYQLTPLQPQARTLEEGLRAALREAQPEYVILGAPLIREGDQATLSNFVRRAKRLNSAIPSHLVIARYHEPVRRGHLLVPLSGPLNLKPLGYLARAMARLHQADLTLAHLLPKGASKADHEAALTLLHEAAVQSGLGGQCQFRVETHDDVVEGLLDMAGEYEAIILGSPSRQSLRRRLYGSTPEQVTRWARCTVYVIRAGS